MELIGKKIIQQPRPHFPVQPLKLTHTPSTLTQVPLSTSPQALLTFVSLKPIPHKPIWGVGGSTIAAMATSQMCLHIENGLYLILDDALFVPKATVKLLSIDSLAKKVGIFTMFGNREATLFRKATNELVAVVILSNCTSVHRKELC